MAVDTPDLGRRAWELFAETGEGATEGCVATVVPELLVRGSTAAPSTVPAALHEAVRRL